MWGGIFWAAGSALLVGCLLGPILVPVLRNLKAGQSVREYMPKEQLKKSGTPIMGGLLIWIALIVSTLVTGNLDRRVITALVATLGFALIGFIDDYMKVVLKRPLGLMARHKIFGQVLFGVLVYYLVGPISTTVVIPYINWPLHLGWLYIPFIVFIMVSMSNAANLTDGMDGLCGGVTLILASFYTLVGLVTEQYSIAAFAAALAGGIAAFLVFNLHTNRMMKVFMGDTGSLGLGAAIGVLAILTKTELLVVVAAGIYVIEALSVTLQVAYFQLTGGKRIFKMSPIHYHFQLSGWSEWAIVVAFWLTGLLFAALAVVGLGGLGAAL